MANELTTGDQALGRPERRYSVQPVRATTPRITVLTAPGCHVCNGTGVRSECWSAALVPGGDFKTRLVPCHCVRLAITDETGRTHVPSPM